MTTPTDPAPGSQPETNSPKPAAKQKLGVVGWSTIVGLAAVVALCALAGRDDDPADGARAACRVLVEDRLRAPSSAEFSNLAHTGSGDRFTVTGVVDAQNAFGAMVRNTFTCEVRLDGDQWRLVRMGGLTN